MLRTFPILLLLMASVGHAAPGGRLEERCGLAVLHLEGGPYSMGRQHGTLLRSRIRARWEDGRRSGLPAIDAARARLSSIPLEILDEIRGIADGAGLPLEAALVLGVQGRGRDSDMIAMRVRPARGHPIIALGTVGSPATFAAVSARGVGLVPRFSGAGVTTLGLRVRHAAQHARDVGEAALLLRDVVGPNTVSLRPATASHRELEGRFGFRAFAVVPSSLRILVSAPGQTGFPVTLEVPPASHGASTSLSPPFRIALAPRAIEERFEPWRSFVNGCRVSTIVFRSPVPSGNARNDLVPADLYEPSFGKVHGAVILMPIWRGGGPFLERYVAGHLAARGFATFILPLPYQFGRTPPGERSGRLTITDDLARNRRVLIQAVTEARWARIWLRERGYREDRICVMGISLGGHVAALAYGVDPGFARGAFVLTGGDIADILWNDSRDTRGVKRRLVARGVTFEQVVEGCREIEPLRYARPWRGSGVVMASATRDETVPPKNVELLRKALGGPPILRIEATHTSGLARIPEIMDFLTEHLRRE